MNTQPISQSSSSINHTNGVGTRFIASNTIDHTTINDTHGTNHTIDHTALDHTHGTNHKSQKKLHPETNLARHYP